MQELIQTYWRKQAGKSFLVVSLDFSLRIVSLFVFPGLYLALALTSIIHTVKIGFIYHERLGHLALNTDLYLRRKWLQPKSTRESHIFLVYSPANRQLLKMFSRQMTIFESELLAKLFSPLAVFNTRFHVSLPFIGNEYEVFNSSPPQIKFTEDESLLGRKYLAELGINSDDWFVCIFARDHKYYRVHSPNTNTAFSDHRNADINTFKLAAEAVVELGGWVVRMGSSVEQPIMFDHPRIIDYASTCRNDFLDIFLTAHARFYVGTTSGASDVAVLFDVPFVGVNYVPIGCQPFGKNSIFIPKKIVAKGTGLLVPLADQLRLFTGNQMSAHLIPEECLGEHDWQFLDNSPEEIKAATLEMVNRLDGRFVEDDRYRELQTRYINLLPNENIYRKNISPMCSSFLTSILNSQIAKNTQRKYVSS